MASAIEMSVSQNALAAVIRRIRNRWRLKLVLHGLSIVLGAALVSILIGPWLMERFRFDPAAVIVVRVLTYGVVAALAVRYLVLPLRRSVSDDRVALYLEEHAPSLQAVVVSAVEASASEAPAAVRSPHFVARLLDSAVASAKAVGGGSQIENKSLTTSAVILAGILAAGLFMVTSSPGRGANMLNPLKDPAARPYFVTVKPGNAQVTRGGDLAIAAQLHGFSAPEALLAVQRDSAGEWERLPMTTLPNGAGFELRLFDIRTPTSYYVESNGVRSPTFKLEVVDLPYVKKLGYELHYPSYTGLPVEVVEQGGDIAALEGTSVVLRATTTQPVKGARLVLDDKRRIPMRLDGNGVLTGTMPIVANGFYKIELETLTGQFVPGSLEYRIDMLEDQPPTVAITKPGADARITAVEEVPAQIEATDDYGITSVQIKYWVNGGPEQSLSLHGDKVRKEVLATHVFTTEEFNLQPGDLVGYYAEVTDNHHRAGGKLQVAKSEMYYLNVRHFDNTYKKPGDQKPKAQSGSFTIPIPPMFSGTQEQVIAATYKINRDREKATPEELSENIHTLLLSQGKVREGVARTLKGLKREKVSAEIRAAVQQALTDAIVEMKAAEEELKKADLPAALTAEQRALRQLLHAEAAYKKVIFKPKPPPPMIIGPMPPSPPTAPPEDLADLFGLKDEEVGNRAELKGSIPGKAPKPRVDPLSEKLQRLAAQLEAETERMKQAKAMVPPPISTKGGSGGGGGGGKPPKKIRDIQGLDVGNPVETQQQQSRDQKSAEKLRDIAKQAKKLSEQLQEVAKDRPSDRDLRESIQDLKKAADDLQRAAAAGKDGKDLAAAALQRMREARERLDKVGAEDRRGADLAAYLADEIAKEENAIEREIKELPAAGEERGQREQALAQRKEILAGQLSALESVVGQLANDNRKDNAAAAHKFQEVGASIRRNKLQDLVRYSKSLLPTSGASNFERQISRETDKLPGQVADAIAALQKSSQEQGGGLLDQARDLARAAESLSDQQQGQGKEPGKGEGKDEAKGEGADKDEDKGESKSDDGKGGDKGEGKGQGEGKGKGKGDGQGEGKGEGKGKGKGGGKGEGKGEGRSGLNQPPKAATQSKKGGNPDAFGGPAGSQRGRVEGEMTAPTVTRKLFTSEYGQLRENAEKMRKDLKKLGVDTEGLDKSIEVMKELEQKNTYDKKAKAEELAGVVTEELKKWEFTLRRIVEKEVMRPALGGTSDVPAEFKPLVAEYYRSIADRP